jgi:TRAP-type mannitol/chloroaromatic compound transport system substrate-binding protein
MISDMSDGRLNIQVYGAGELIPAFEGFDAVRAGTVEMNHANSYFWTGKTFAAQYFTAVPFGMNFQGMNGWFYDGGGIDLWNEVYAPFGMVAMPCGNTGVQMTGWFKKEIKTVADLKGLKMRIPGLGGDVMAKLGASPVSLPGGQIYENLVSGAIEATEWVGPYNDYFMKFYEAAKFYYSAGMHEPGGGLALGMNKSWWEGLSDIEKSIITAASNEELAAQHEEASANNGEYLNRLVKDHGVVVKSFSDEVWDAFGSAAKEVFEETRNHSPLAAKINDDYQAKLREIGGFRKIAEIEFSNQRNRVLGI